jgi:hypothetical protein
VAWQDLNSIHNPATGTSPPASWGDQVRDNFEALPRGVMGRATKSTDQTAISTVVDLSGLSVTWTAVTGRLYRISYSVTYLKNTAAGLLRTQVTTSANAIVRLHLDYAPTAATYYTHAGSVLVTPSAGSVTYKLRAVCDVNTSDQAGATDPALILVEDIGPS